MADTKTTVEMQAPPEWAIAMKQDIVSGFARVEANLAVQGTELHTLGARVGVIEGRMSVVESRQTISSERVKQGSAVDLTHEADIADIRATVEALAARPDTGAQVLAAIDKLAERPLVKRLTAAVVPVLLLAISLLGVKLQAQMAKLEAVAPAPAPSVVYVPAPVDGGAQ